jgi:hypothetical protein
MNFTQNLPYVYWSEKYFEQKLWREIKCFMLSAVLCKTALRRKIKYFMLSAVLCKTAGFG